MLVFNQNILFSIPISWHIFWWYCMQQMNDELFTPVECRKCVCDCVWMHVYMRLCAWLWDQGMGSLIKRMPCPGRHLTSLSSGVWTHLIACTAAEDLDPVWAQSAPAEDRSHSHFFHRSAIALDRQQLLTQIGSQYSDMLQLFLGYILQDRKSISCIYWHSEWDMLSGVTQTQLWILIASKFAYFLITESELLPIIA